MDKKWPISENPNFLLEIFPYPENLSKPYQFKCPDCNGLKIFVWTQPSKTNPGTICHLLICIDCGSYCCLGGVNKILCQLPV